MNYIAPVTDFSVNPNDRSLKISTNSVTHILESRRIVSDNSLDVLGVFSYPKLDGSGQYRFTKFSAMRFGMMPQSRACTWSPVSGMTSSSGLIKPFYFESQMTFCGNHEVCLGMSSIFNTDPETGQYNTAAIELLGNEFVKQNLSDQSQLLAFGNHPDVLAARNGQTWVNTRVLDQTSFEMMYKMLYGALQESEQNKEFAGYYTIIDALSNGANAEIDGAGFLSASDFQGSELLSNGIDLVTSLIRRVKGPLAVALRSGTNKLICIVSDSIFQKLRNDLRANSIGADDYLANVLNDELPTDIRSVSLSNAFSFGNIIFTTDGLAEQQCLENGIYRHRMLLTTPGNIGLLFTGDTSENMGLSIEVQQSTVLREKGRVDGRAFVAMAAAVIDPTLMFNATYAVNM